MCAYSECLSSIKSDASMDAVHDAWVEMHPKYGSRLSAAALRRRAIYRQTDEARRAKQRTDAAVFAECDCPAWQQPQQAAIQNERDEIIRTLIAALPPELARAIYLRYWSDLTVAEISRVVNRRPKTIYRWLQHAHDRLAEASSLRQLI